ncbi:MAG: HAMP domain-containing histidine kinase [Tissierellia bacterium]|nr:HAMP domain-containing histidine kinase [Tissierellia bacterium]
MNKLMYFKKKIPDLVIYLVILTIFSIIMFQYEIRPFLLLVFIIGYTLFIGVYYCIDYIIVKKRFEKYNRLIDSLDKKYLFPQLVFEKLIDDNWLKIINRMSKSMAEEVNYERIEKEIYRDYIEIMIHEIKNPLATINLISSNNKTEFNRKILSQTELISNLIEQALYLAKLENLEKDYHIKEHSIEDLVNSAILQNRVSLLENGFGIEKSELENYILTDKKWFVFILSQIISNSIKYVKDSPKLVFASEEFETKSVLTIEDNGSGFKEYELNRVFDKGFTGEKSDNLNSTGMGLYIVKVLCERLNIEVSNGKSSMGGARITLQIPKENFERQL